MPEPRWRSGWSTRRRAPVIGHQAARRVITMPAIPLGARAARNTDGARMVRCAPAHQPICTALAQPMGLIHRPGVMPMTQAPDRSSYRRSRPRAARTLMEGRGLRPSLQEIDITGNG